MKELGFHDTVVITPWQSMWEDKFKKEKNIIEASLNECGLIGQILHVGSTSIQGMPSKPIIDILMLVDDSQAFEPYIEALCRSDYHYLGECGRPGRHFFSKGDLPNNSFYLHLCYQDNQVARDQLLFQKIERNDTTVFSNYMNMKYIAAAAFSEDRNMYRVLKGTFIDTVLHLYRDMNPAFEDGEEV